MKHHIKKTLFTVKTVYIHISFIVTNKEMHHMQYLFLIYYVQTMYIHVSFIVTKREMQF